MALLSCLRKKTYFLCVFWFVGQFWKHGPWRQWDSSESGCAGEVQSTRKTGERGLFEVAPSQEATWMKTEAMRYASENWGRNMVCSEKESNCWTVRFLRFSRFRGYSSTSYNNIYIFIMWDSPNAMQLHIPMGGVHVIGTLRLQPAIQGARKRLIALEVQREVQLMETSEMGRGDCNHQFLVFSLFRCFHLKYGQFEASNMAIAMGMCCHRELDSSNGANLHQRSNRLNVAVKKSDVPQRHKRLASSRTDFKFRFYKYVK